MATCHFQERMADVLRQIESGSEESGLLAEPLVPFLGFEVLLQAAALSQVARTTPLEILWRTELDSAKSARAQLEFEG